MTTGRPISLHLGRFKEAVHLDGGGIFVSIGPVDMHCSSSADGNFASGTVNGHGSKLVPVIEDDGLQQVSGTAEDNQDIAGNVGLARA